MLVFFDTAHLTFCRIGLHMLLRQWDIAIFGVRYNVGGGEILWSSGCVVQCWRGWDLVIFWVCGIMLEREICCDLLGLWEHVGEGEILRASGCVVQYWRGRDVVIIWVCGNMLGKVRCCDLLGVWEHVWEREMLWNSGCVGPFGGVWHCDFLGVCHHVGEREEKLRLDRTSVLYRPLSNLTDNN
jgi:hypothetical protein